MLLLKTNLVSLLCGKNITAITLWPFIFINPRHPFTIITRSHERIHLRQQTEMLVIFFYLWYISEWLYKLLIYRNAGKAYFNISFEREAYQNEDNLKYYKTRKCYSWLKYL